MSETSKEASTQLKKHTTNTLDEGLFDAAQLLIRSKDRSVLLVEDTASHAVIIRRALDAGGWSTEHVTRGSAAEDAFNKDPHRIVFRKLAHHQQLFVVWVSRRITNNC